MKKFTVLFLISLSLSFNILSIKPLAATTVNLLKQGIYSLSDLNISPNNLYNIVNTSSTKDAYLLVFDKNYVIMQSLRLSPGIKSFNLVPLQPDYKIILLGDTEIYISPRPTGQ
ncbi:MAG: hypothetical protein ABRQ25_19165 [Clostridiaceae bacterium]